MNLRKMIYVMSILMIFAVYITSNVILNGCNDKDTSSTQQETEKNYVDENVENIRLAGRVVVIDSGHGGIDPGKIGINNVHEKDINLAIALKLRDMLTQSQITVVMTRTEDVGLYKVTDKNKKSADMKARCDIINNSNADIAVSIHQNSYTTPDVKGAQVFYYKGSQSGKILAGQIQKALVSKADPDNNRVEKANSDYYLLVNTKVPTIIAECGFLSNPEETALLMTEEYQCKIAAALYDGIVGYLEEEIENDN
ncbi:MAG: N-acetylmuramoyl-L-alanine amidase [Lachnospira sp.]